jgi:hypothetical protein
MIQVIWEFVVKARAVDRFEHAYGPRGPWVRLFRAYPGYRGTTLLRDIENPRRHLTIDLWATPAARERMLAHAKARYSTLDKAFADLTESEQEIGIFSTPRAGKVRRQSEAKRSEDAGVRGSRRRRR